MSARKKLNIAFVNGGLFLASLAGVMAQSWLVFGSVLAALLAVNLCLGEIRPSKGRQPGRNG
jgi:hypothetical protein